MFPRLREFGYQKIAFAPFALIFIFTVVLMNRYRTVRIHPVVNSRFGEFAINTELSILNSLEDDANKKIKSINVFCLQHHTSSNMFLESLLRRQQFVISGTFGWLILFFIKKISPKYLLQSTTTSDGLGLLLKYPASFAFSVDEIRRGFDFLNSLGLKKESRYVCLNVRDSSFLANSNPMGWSKNKDWSYHSYRDSDIANYVSAAEKLAEMGYTVFRMGALVNKSLNSMHPMVIDYATNGMRSEFLDLFLGAHCTFCVSTGTGWDTIPQIFRRPTLYVNLIPVVLGDCINRDLLIYPKVLLDRDSHNELKLNEICDRKGPELCDTKMYDEVGISIRDMSVEELVQAVTEMAARVEGRFVPTEQQKSMQEKLRHELMTNPKVQPSPGFYPIRAEYASCFLSNYPNFLD